jgi:hypothetical protein
MGQTAFKWVTQSLQIVQRIGSSSVQSEEA